MSLDVPEARRDAANLGGRRRSHLPSHSGEVTLRAGSIGRGTYNVVGGIMAKIILVVVSAVGLVVVLIGMFAWALIKFMKEYEASVEGKRRSFGSDVYDYGSRDFDKPYNEFGGLNGPDFK